MQIIGTGELVQSMKYMPYKHENMNLSLRTHVGEKSVESWYMLVTSSGETVDPWGLSASQLSLLGRPPGQRKALSKKIRWMMPCEEMALKVVLWLLNTCAYMVHTQTCTHMHTDY